MTNEKITIKNWIVQKEGNIVSDMDGEKVMLSVERGKYYNLGQIGGDIWEHIVNPTSIEHLITKLTTKYEVQQRECEDQVLSFIDSLIREDLVRLVK